MSEPMNRKAQSVSQVPNSETKSCETCKHSYDMPDWYEPMWKSIPADIVKHCSLVGLAEYGKDGCAYEPINKGETDGE